MMGNPHNKNRPMMKHNTGDANEAAKDRADHHTPPANEAYSEGHDDINWRSNQGLPPASGDRCRSTTHAEANLPMHGEP